MIFVTIGTQAPFDRLIKTIDDIAREINEPIIAQIFESQYKAHNIQTVDFLSPKEFNKLFEEARLVVSHAGMGTIITALLKHKPIIICPRFASLGEHRNDHQLHTVMKMNELRYTHVAYDKQQLKELLLNKDIEVLHHIGEEASISLVSSIKQYLEF